MRVFPEPVGSAAMTLATRVGQQVPAGQWNSTHLFEPLQTLPLGIGVVRVRLAYVAFRCRSRRDLTSPYFNFNSRSSRTEVLLSSERGKMCVCKSWCSWTCSRLDFGIVLCSHVHPQVIPLRRTWCQIRLIPQVPSGYLMVGSWRGSRIAKAPIQFLTHTTNLIRLNRGPYLDRPPWMSIPTKILNCKRLKYRLRFPTESYIATMLYGNTGSCLLVSQHLRLRLRRHHRHWTISWTILPQRSSWN